ncbi:hypothetical protein ABIB62_000714 [Mucilaginibacter sp. UYP25]|uniref:hypothetical protein n=1 Tax=unclassified Mucilaginibacter TaxID=2617802 RepID=UPI003398215F
MKNYFSRFAERHLAFTFFLLSLFIVVLVYSCKKEITTSTTPLDNTVQSITIKEAKAWFETNAKINKQSSQATNSLNDRKWNEGINLDWNKPDVYSKFKGSFVELPLVNSSVVFAFDRTNANGITQQNNYTKTSFIVQKDSLGVFRGWYMVLIADTAFINGNFARLNLNTYKSHDKDFSGRLLYYTAQGEFLAGWRYEKGIITNTLSVTSGIPATPSKQVNSKQDINVAQLCYSQPVVTTTASCFTNPATGMYDCTYTYTTSYITQCYDVPDGGGSGGSGGGGSGGGGTNPGDFPPPPPPNPCPPVGGVAIVGGQHVNLVPGGGGGGGTNPCTPVPPPEDPCDKIRKQKAKADLKTQLADLKSKLNLNYETGYLKSVGTVAQYRTGTPNTLSWDAPQPSSLANASLEYIVHSHYAAQLSLSTFSNSDINAFFQYVQQNKVANKDSFSFSVITSQGTTYSMMIGDYQKFTSAFTTYFSDQLGRDLFDNIYNNYIKAGNTTIQNETNLLSMINTLNMGISVLKANTDFSNWVVESYDPITNTITLKNCN